MTEPNETGDLDSQCQRFYSGSDSGIDAAENALPF